MGKSIVQLLSEDYFRRMLENGRDKELDLTDELREILQSMPNTDIELKQKVDNIVKFFEITEDLIEAKRRRIEKIKDQIAKLENARDKFKEFLIYIMDHYDTKELNGYESKISVVEGDYKIEAVYLDDLSEDFKRVKMTVEPDKKKILEHFKQTGEIPRGVKISKTKYLRIK